LNEFASVFLEIIFEISLGQISSHEIRHCWHAAHHHGKTALVKALRD